MVLLHSIPQILVRFQSMCDACAYAVRDRKLKPTQIQGRAEGQGEVCAGVPYNLQLNRHI